MIFKFYFLIFLNYYQIQFKKNILITKIYTVNIEI